MKADKVHESARREALERYQIIDTPPEESFDRITRLVARYFDVPICLISFVDGRRQWLKAHLGVDFCSVDRDISICSRVAEAGELLLIENALEDPRYAGSELVTGPPGIRSYAGAPLKTADGISIGTLCLIDTEPRTFSETDVEVLIDFAAEAVEQLERRRAEMEAHQARQQTGEILQSISDAFFAVDAEWRLTYINDMAEPLLRNRREALLGKNIWEEYPESVGSAFYHEYHRAVRDRTPVNFTEYYAPFDAWFEVRAYPFEGGLSIYFTDVTERVLEQEFRAAEARILEMISAGAPLHESLEALIEAVEARSSGFLGSVLLLDADGKHLRYGAAPSLPEAFTSQLDGVEVASQLGPCATAASTRQTVVLDDIQRNPQWPDFRIALEYGFYACWSQPILGSDGEVLGTFALYYGEPRTPSEADLTLIRRAGYLAGIIIERSRRAKALRESEKRFRSLIEATTSIVWTTPASGEFETEQPDWSAFTGQPYEVFKGWGWMDAIHPDDRPHTAGAWRTALEGRSLYQTEYRLRRHDGAFRHMLVRAVPVLDDEGEVREWVGIHTDVTERKQAEEALRESRERLSAIIDQTVVGIFQTDLEGRIVLVNESFCSLVGRTEEELLKLRLQDLLHPEDLPHSMLLFEELVTEGEDFWVEKRYLHADGSSVWVNKTLSLVRDADGDPLYVVAVVQDITDRKRVEELQRSNRELEQFAYVASHDLQEPLRKIHSFSDLLAGDYGDVLDEVGRDYVERIQQSTARMQTLIRDLLAYSRITTRPAPLKQVDLQQVADNVLSDLESRIEESGAEVHVQELPMVLADSLQMRQLLQNLIGNALKFSKAGERPRVKVYAERVAGAEQPDHAEAYHIYVEDNGVGFDEKYLEKIFAPFQRLHKRNAYEGTGIGLAICKKIVERHGGELTARSKPGEGATFIVTLPIDGEPVPSAAVDAS